MSQPILSNDLLVGLRASMAINARDETLDMFVQIAAEYIAAGLTQEGADVLAFVMRCDAVPDDIEDHAYDLWDDLARWICPRVLLDAETFGKKAYLEDVVDYILAGQT